MNYLNMFPNQIYEYIEDIPVCTANSNFEYICSICQNDGSENFIFTKCFHPFHRDCMQQLIDIGKKNDLKIGCPMCRAYLK